MMRPDAMTARIVRNGKESVELLIKSEQAMATLVQSGDSIKVSGLESSNQFLYIGGDVSLPGEKTFRAGLTLTQALLAAGGVSRGQNAAVKISRRNSEGFLTIHEYRLRAIEEGKSPDPLIHPGDRIEVSRM
jgi:protein involved in polysaccharide export with SLBB domain